MTATNATNNMPDPAALASTAVLALAASLEADIAKAEAMGYRLVRKYLWLSVRRKCGCVDALAALGASPNLAGRSFLLPEAGMALGLEQATLVGISDGFEGATPNYDVGRFPDYDLGYAAGLLIARRRFPEQFDPAPADDERLDDLERSWDDVPTRTP